MRTATGKVWRRVAAALSIALGMAACAGPANLSVPIDRELTWFTYLTGDDVRRACGTDERDRFRLVFNADDNQHVRTYDLTEDDRGGAVVEVHVLEAPDISHIDLSNPMTAGRSIGAKARLSPEQFDLLRLGLATSGAFSLPDGTKRLPSNGFYWLVNGCHEGRWFFNAYPYPSDRFVEVRFAEVLPLFDQVGIPHFRLLPPGKEASPQAGIVGGR